MGIDNQLKIRQLDRKLRAFGELAQLHIPSKGWISEIRRALGMTASQLGQRLKVSQPAVTQNEEKRSQWRDHDRDVAKRGGGLGM